MIQQTLVWATFCLMALGVVARWPQAGRVGLGAFFIVMALGVNVGYVLLAPDGFVGLGTDAPLLAPYAWVFTHVVSAAPAVFGLSVAAYEITVGVLMVRGGRSARWGLLGGIAFLVASSPLGPWTLPNLVLAAALVVLLRGQPGRAMIEPAAWPGRSAPAATR